MAENPNETKEATVSRDVTWYCKEIPSEMFSISMRTVLRDYSKIPDDQVEKHIYEIRDKAWDIFPYVCTGRFTFLQLSIGDAPQYQEVLQRVKDGEQFLDIGCNFGQDLRKLVFDGAPSENLYGSDLEEGFFSLGYELFNDRESLKSSFVAADAIEEKSALDKLSGQFSIIHASSFFHLFDRPTQIKAGVRCVSLLQREPGSLIFGRQSGTMTAGPYTNRIAQALCRASELFRHNEQSWQELWDEIGALTGTKWKVQAYLYEDESTRLHAAGNEARRMRFEMRME